MAKKRKATVGVSWPHSKAAALPAGVRELTMTRKRKQLVSESPAGGKTMARFYLGIVRYHLGAMPRAIDDFAEAISGAYLSADRAEACALRGLVRMKQSGYERKASPGFVHYNAASTCSLMGESDQAWRSLAEAIGYDPALCDNARRAPDFYPRHRQVCFQELIRGW